MGCVQTKSRVVISSRKKALQPYEIESLKLLYINQSLIDLEYSIIYLISEEFNKKRYLVKNKKTGRDMQMTLIARNKETEDKEYVEKLSNVKRISHQNILHIVDIYEDNVNFYFISEQVKGCQIYEIMKNQSNFTEKIAGKIFSQIASMIYYLHYRGCVHGFIRPEIINLWKEQTGCEALNESSNENFNVLLLDFGDLMNFSHEYQEELNKIDSLYKPFHLAPEILRNRNVTEKVDVFACGVILYTMICGRPPYYGITHREIKDKILQGDLKFDDVEWKSISPSVKDLIIKMLNPSPEKRISSKDIICHSWVVYSREEEHYSKQVLTELNNKLSDFHKRNHLQHTTMTIIANQITNSSKVKELKKLFREFDKNGDGVLSYHEFKVGFEIVFGKNLMGLEVDQIIKEIDKNNSGFIEYDEFLAATVSNSDILNDKILKEAFNKYDSDGSGKLSRAEMIGLVGNDSELIESLMSKADDNKDGELSYEEFKNVISILVIEKLNNKEKERAGLEPCISGSSPNAQEKSKKSTSKKKNKKGSVK